MAAPSCCPFDELVKLTEKDWTSTDLIEIQRLHDASTCLHPPLKEIVLTVPRHGQSCSITPLFIAIEQGDLEMVKIIIHTWGVDIHAALDIYHIKPLHSQNLLTFGQVNPLFAAAYFKHFEIVRYLVGQGANISAGASSFDMMDDEDDEESGVELTPLHAAFLLLEGDNVESVQLDIIRFLVNSGADPNALSSNEPFLSRMVCLACCYTQLKGREIQFKNWINPSSIFLLVQLGLSVTQKSPSGRTVLHYLADNFTIVNADAFVNLLLEKGANLQARDMCGFSPIMCAATGSDWVPNIYFLEYLLKRADVPNKDKIEALEVTAAVLLKGTNAVLFNIAYDYLTQARTFRMQEGLPLTLQPQKNGRATEKVTSTTNKQDFLQRQDEFPMQSILIRLRIFSALSWQAVYQRLLRPYIDNRFFKNLHEENLHDQILDISWNMLETISHFDPHEDGIWFATVHIVEWLAESLEQLRRWNYPLFSIVSLEAILDLASDTYQIIHDDDDDDLSGRYFVGLYRLISMSTGLLPTAGIINSVRNIVGQNGRDNYGNTWIHICLYAALFYHPGEDFLPVINLLKENGADLHAVDQRGVGALHILASWEGKQGKNIFVTAAARFLLDEGLHLDRVDNNRLTAAYYYRHFKSLHQVGGQDSNNLPDWLREGVPKLMCQCAKVIKRLEIPYQHPGYLPVTLPPFVDIH